MAKRIRSARIQNLIPWLSAATVIVIFFSTAGIMVQTSQRTAANNPQFQMAEDTAAQLKQWSSSSVSTANLEPHVDISNSLAPFVIIYNNLGQPIDGTGYINGKLPTIPYGVLQRATQNNPHAVTWQPEPGVRVATVVSLSPLGNYVLAGRSLKEVEQEENTTYLLMFVGMGASLIVLSMMYLTYTGFQ